MHRFAPTVLVMADDLTGANDAGVQFAAAGIRSVVITHPVVDRLPDYPVVVVNTESRHITGKEAAERVRRIAELGKRAGVKCFYKKTDSTLRGNIGAELEALLSATGDSCIPFVPALPDLGRVTREGIHYVHGTPVAETAFARDPLNPVRSSRVAEVLSAHATIRVSNCGSVDGVAAGIAILDCESNDDLAEIAGGLAATNRLKVVSGSVGLARHLVEHLEFPGDAPEVPDPQLPILLVNGSVNERALEQITRPSPHFARVRLSAEMLIDREVQLTLPAGRNVLLHSISERSELESYSRLAQRRGISQEDLHLRVAEQTGNIVRQILATGVFRTVVVFGGDTLAGIARANHWQELEPLAEMEPGVSVAKVMGTRLTLISKAGGFGDADVVSRIVRWVETHQN
jgi:uncharacterized protein YgbK (DUF1537 family)